MTDREKAIVMAYTGVAMLTGDKFQIFHKYVEDIMGRPIMIDDIGWLEYEIKEKSKADFMALCNDDSSSEKQTKWISVSEKLPEKDGRYFVTVKRGYVTTAIWVGFAEDWNEVTAWMPLPEPYKASPTGEEVEE